WAMVRAVVTISWSLTVYGAPLGRCGSTSSVTSTPFPGDGSGVPRATRAGRAQAEGRPAGACGVSGGRTGGADGELSRPPYSSAAVARTRRPAGPPRAAWVLGRNTPRPAA